MSLTNNERLFEQIPGAGKEIHVAEGATHGDIWEMDREAYAEKVLAFLEKSGFVDDLESPAGDGESNDLESPAGDWESDESR